MREIHTRIEIQSSPQAIWDILTDIARYPEWNPFIPYAKGPVERDGMLSIKIKTPAHAPQAYRVKILNLEAPRQLVWLGHFHVPHLIDGEHYFEIKPAGPDNVEFVQREYFRGMLVPFTWKSFLNTELRAGFEALNRSLKAVAER